MSNIRSRYVAGRAVAAFIVSFQLTACGGGAGEVIATQAAAAAAPVLTGGTTASATNAAASPAPGRSGQPARGTTMPDPELAGPKTWKPESLIENRSGTARAPKIVVDHRGNAIAVWIQSEGYDENLYANRYAPGTGWGAAQLIESESGYASSPQIGIDGDGNVIVVWEHRLTQSVIYANRFTVGSGWGTAQRIAYGPGVPLHIQIAVAPQGHAMAMWHWDGGAGGRTERIYSVRYAPASGWETSQQIEATAGDGYVQDLQMAIDDMGNTVAVWTQVNDGVGSIYANRYVPASGWGSRQPIESGTGPAGAPRIAVDGNGHAIAVWQQYDGASGSIYANRLSPEDGWASAQLIQSASGTASAPQINIDRGGNGIVVWAQHDGASYRMHANRYIPAAGWGTSQASAVFNGHPLDIRSAMDAAGNVAVMWKQLNGEVGQLFANHYTLQNGWDTAQPIASPNSPTSHHELGVAGNGNAMVVWLRHESDTWSVYANRYD